MIRGYAKAGLPVSELRGILTVLIDIVSSEHTDKEARGAFVGTTFGALAPLLTQDGEAATYGGSDDAFDH